MSNANKILLNARVRRIDGTITYINKVNANGYSTDAKGPQIPVKRLVLAGKTLKEIEQPFAKGEFVIVQGVAVKLNKRQQRELADGTLDEKALRPDFGTLVIIDPETGKATDGKKVKSKSGVKASLKATRERNKDTSTKKERKAERAKAHDEDALDLVPEGKIDRKAELIRTIDASIEGAATKDQRKQFAEAFGIDWKEIKKLGGKGVVKQLGRKDAKAACDKLRVTVTGDAYIKHMPNELKRLIQDGRLTLNKKQIERVLDIFGLDAAFYSVAAQTLLGNLALTLERSAEPKAGKKKAKKARPTYATDKEVQRRIKKMSIKLIMPSKKELKNAKAHLKTAKAVMADKLGISTKEIKRGLFVYKPNGVELMFLACDSTGPVFIDKDGAECVLAYANVADTFNFTLSASSELDAAV